jgi:hypothetical protein
LGGSEEIREGNGCQHEVGRGRLFVLDPERWVELLVFGSVWEPTAVGSTPTVGLASPTAVEALQRWV